MRNRAHKRIRRAIVWWSLMVLLPALAGCSSEGRVKNLAAELTDGRSCARKIWVIQTLGALKDPAAVPALVASLEDPDPSVRKASAWALGQVNGPQAQDALTLALNHWDEKVRNEAAWALAKKPDYPLSLDALLAAVKGR